MRRFLVLSLLALSVLARAQDLTAEQKTSVLDGMGDIITKRAFLPGVDFKKWPEIVASKKEKIDAATDIPSFSRVLNEALREFGVSHIRLMTPTVASRRNQTSAVGTGATVTKSDEGLQVRNVNDNGPAKALGLEQGDVITKVNGEKADDPTKLEGEEGKKVTVEVKKANGEVKTMEVELKRFSTVRTEPLTFDGSTAMMRIYTFNAGYGRTNLEDHIKEMNEKGAKSLILDLRSNGGGAISNLNHLLSLLMPDKTVYGTFVSRRLQDQYTQEKPDAPVDVASIAAWAPNKTATRQRTVEPFKGKIFVLINRGTGSASEICAESLRENVHATILGQKSAGAVLASTYGKLPEGFLLQYPVSDFVSANGTRLEKNPIMPDVEVAGAASKDEDPVMAKALELAKAAN